MPKFIVTRSMMAGLEDKGEGKVEKVYFTRGQVIDSGKFTGKLIKNVKQWLVPEDSKEGRDIAKSAKAKSKTTTGE